MNFDAIVCEVIKGNYDAIKELNNFKQVDKEHIQELYKYDVRDSEDKEEWLTRVANEYKPEVAALIKEQYASLNNKSVTKTRSGHRSKLLDMVISTRDNFEGLCESNMNRPRNMSSKKDTIESVWDGYSNVSGFDFESTFGFNPESEVVCKDPELQINEDFYDTSANKQETIIEPKHQFKSIPQLLRGTPESAGHDITSLVDVTVPARGFASVETGVRISIPAGFHADVRPRSGLGFRNQVVAFNGVIDSDYSSVDPDNARCANTIKVGMFNFSDSDYVIKVGDRIAQLVICKDYYFDNSVIGDSSSHNGFGSTGK